MQPRNLISALFTATVLSAGLLTACSSKPQQAPCPPVNSGSFNLPDPEAVPALKVHRLTRLDSAAMAGFQSDSQAPLNQLIQAIQGLRYDALELPPPAVNRKPLSQPGLKLSTESLDYLVTDLSAGHDNLLNSLYGFVQQGGAVGVISLTSPYQGTVPSAAGSFSFKGQRRLYLFVAGHYAHVDKALKLLRDDPETQGLIKPSELTVFVKRKLKGATSFPDPNELQQYRSRLTQPDQHPMIQALQSGVASSVEAVNRSLQIDAAKAHDYSTFLVGNATKNRRLPYVAASCPHQNLLEVEIKNQEKTLGLRQLFVYAPRDFAPRLTSMYVDRAANGLVLEELLPGQNVKSPDQQAFKPVTVPGTIETHRAFEALWQKPESGSAEAGVPFNDADPVGAFYIQFSGLDKLLSDRLYRLPVKIYASRTGQGSGESASRFYTTAIPVQAWNLGSADAVYCRGARANAPLCGQTPGFAVFYEKLLKACVPFNEGGQGNQREAVAEFYYYLKRK